MERRREQRKEGRKKRMRDGKKERTKEGRKEGRMRDSTWWGGEGKGAGKMVISGATDHMNSCLEYFLPPPPPPSRQCSTFVPKVS